MKTMQESDILDLLTDLHKQATEEHSHYYTGKVIKLAIIEILNLREEVANLKLKKPT